MPHVEDRDLGWAAMVRAAAKADGLELRNGILDHRLRYPATSGAEGQFISKVAAIHGVFRAISQGYDMSRSDIDVGMRRLLVAIHDGRGDAGELIQELIGEPIQKRQRNALLSLLKKRTGRMWKAIRSTVFADGRIGSTRAAYRGTRVAGDDPSEPKGTQQV